ncbi:MAG: hypothetical protein ACI94Y_002509 [Maribacter sp.]|jgi:hypothetical protein
MRILFQIFIFIFCSQNLLAQGAIDGYMKEGGVTDIAVSYGYDHYEKYYLGDQLQDTFNRTYQSASIFLAYGLEENLDIIASIPFMWTDANNRGFQDGQFFIKYRAMKKEIKKGRLDLMIAGGVTTALSAYKISPESDNPIGERPTILEARIVAQHNFKNGLFVMGKVGLSYKIKPIVQPIIPTVFRVGYGHSKFYTDFWVEATATIGAEANEVPLGQEGSTFVKFGGTFYVPVAKFFGVFVNGSYTPWGRNVGISPRIGAGFVLKIIPKKVRE